jgi:nucleoside-diphosphate-sugar epimerase
MAQFLITGAGGLHWVRLTQAAIGAGHRVTAADRFYFGQESLQGLTGNETLRILRSDIRDLAPSDFEGVDAVFDLAALSNDPSSDLDPSLTTAVNYQGRLHVATCESGWRRGHCQDVDGGWYRTIIEADRLLDQVRLNDRLL